MAEYIIDNSKYNRIVLAANRHNFDMLDDIAEELEKNEVIRCKDCMFGNHEYGGTLLKGHVWCCDIERIRNDSEFCSRGVAWDGE